MIRSILLFAFASALSLGSQAQSPLYLDDTAPLESRVEDLLGRMTLQEKIRVIHAQSKFSSAGVPRLGIPDFWTDDGPHGVRPDVLWDQWEQAGQTNDSCIAFPALTCLAASWNPSMAGLYGKSLGEEALYRGKDMILGPGVNIYRTPLGGRNFEYLGEDPFLSSTMVVPYVRGLQSNGVAACVKHFCLNNDEEFRSKVNVVVSDRALHEIYLPAFKAAVEQGHVWGLMGAYNLYRQQHNCHNEFLLNKILKHDWKFDGVVVSDWGGCHTTDEAANNGLDMEFGTWTDGLTEGASNAYESYHLAMPYFRGLKSGKYAMSTLDDKVRRVLRLFFRTTMSQRGHGMLCSESHYDAARRIAEDGIVLLKNDRGVLPIDKSRVKNILIVGENAIKMMTVGGGSSSLKVQKEKLPYDILKQKLEKAGVSVSYERGYVGDTGGAYNGVVTGQNLKDNRSALQLIDDAVTKARKADIVILFGGLNKSGYQDCEGHDRKSYDLPYGQDDLVRALIKANPNLVFVNISGNAVRMPWRKDVPAIVQGWYLGSEAGEALSAVLTGEVNPSGKLPFTWPVELKDCGAIALGTYPGTWRHGNCKGDTIDENYKEGLYVGYRWVDHARTKPAFAFGHGLSYTTFKLSDLRLSRREMTQSDSITFSVTVKNTGKYAGAEVVQLYLHDNKSTLERPYKELKGFRKVFLQRGESRQVDITVGKDALSYYDDRTGAWVAEPGVFTALVGDASDRLPLSATFTLR